MLVQQEAPLFLGLRCYACLYFAYEFLLIKGLSNTSGSQQSVDPLPPRLDLVQPRQQKLGIEPVFRLPEGIDAQHEARRVHLCQRQFLAVGEKWGSILKERRNLILHRFDHAFGPLHLVLMRGSKRDTEHLRGNLGGEGVDKESDVGPLERGFESGGSGEEV
jgi:hypothetical protein